MTDTKVGIEKKSVKKTQNKVSGNLNKMSEIPIKMTKQNSIFENIELEELNRESKSHIFNVSACGVYFYEKYFERNICYDGTKKIGNVGKIYILNKEIMIWEQLTKGQLKTIIYRYLLEELKNISIEQKEKEKILKESNINSIYIAIKNISSNYKFSEKLDIDPDVLNFKNGIICLKTLKFRSRTKDDYYSKYYDYNYDENVLKKIMEYKKEKMK
jgi:hypothetical protein